LLRSISIPALKVHRQSSPFRDKGEQASRWRPSPPNYAHMGATSPSPSESAAASQVRAFPLPQQTIRPCSGAPSLRPGAAHGVRPPISSVPRHHHEAQDHPTAAGFVPGGVVRVRSSRSPCTPTCPGTPPVSSPVPAPRLISPMLIDRLQIV
jgi:hypothetical protein